MFSAFLHVGADFLRAFTTLALWRLGGDVGTWGRGHWQLVASRTAIMALNEKKHYRKIKENKERDMKTVEVFFRWCPLLCLIIFDCSSRELCLVTAS